MEPGVALILCLFVVVVVVVVCLKHPLPYTKVTLFLMFGNT